MAAIDVISALNVVPVRPVAPPENRAVDGPASSVPEPSEPRSGDRTSRSNFRSKLSDSLRSNSRREARTQDADRAQQPDPQPSEPANATSAREADASDRAEPRSQDDGSDVEQADDAPADSAPQPQAVQPAIDLTTAAEIVQSAAVSAPVAPPVNLDPQPANSPPPGLIQATQTWTQRTAPAPQVPVAVAPQKPPTIPEGLLPADNLSDAPAKGSQTPVAQAGTTVAQVSQTDTSDQVQTDAIEELPPVPVVNQDTPDDEPQPEVQPVEAPPPVPSPLQTRRTGTPQQIRVNSHLNPQITTRKTSVEAPAKPVEVNPAAETQAVEADDVQEPAVNPAATNAADQSSAPAAETPALNLAADEQTANAGLTAPKPAKPERNAPVPQAPADSGPQVTTGQTTVPVALPPSAAQVAAVANAGEPPAINPTATIDFQAPTDGAIRRGLTTPVFDSGAADQQSASVVSQFDGKPLTIQTSTTAGVNPIAVAGTKGLEAVGTAEKHLPEAVDETASADASQDLTGTPAVSTAGNVPVDSKVDRLRHPGESRVAIDPRQVLHQVARSVQSAADSGTPTLRVRLDPPELGPLQIDVSVTSAGVSARLEAESNATQRLLQDNLGQLREALAQQGVTVDKLTIEKHSDPGRSDLADRSFQQQQQQQQTGDREVGRQQRQPQAPDPGPFERVQSPAAPRPGGSARNGRLDVHV